MEGENGSGPANGSGTLAQHVAGRLMALRSEMAENSRRFAIVDLRMEGLTRVLLRGVAFSGEHADQVATVIEEAASTEHQQGEALFVAAQDIRALVPPDGRIQQRKDD